MGFDIAQSARITGLASVLIVLLVVQFGPTIMIPVLPDFIGTLSAAGYAASSAGIALSIMVEWERFPPSLPAS